MPIRLFKYRWNPLPRKWAPCQKNLSFEFNRVALNVSTPEPIPKQLGAFLKENVLKTQRFALG